MKKLKNKRLTLVDVHDGLMDLKAVERGFVQPDARFAARTAQLEEVMCRRFDAHDDRFDAMDKRFDAMDERFDAMERRFDGRFDRLEDRVGSLELGPAG